MLSSPRNLRVLFRLVVVLFAVLGIRSATGCNSAGYTVSGPCTGPQCTCEQDPNQSRCKGFNDRPEGGLIDQSDGATDAADATDATDLDSGDADSGPDDGGDEAG